MVVSNYIIASNSLPKYKLNSNYAFLDSFGPKFLPRASIRPLKIKGHVVLDLDIGRNVDFHPDGPHAGKVVETLAMDLDNLKKLKSFSSKRVKEGMLLAERNDKLFIIDPTL